MKTFIPSLIEAATELCSFEPNDKISQEKSEASQEEDDSWSLGSEQIETLDDSSQEIRHQAVLLIKAIHTAGFDAQNLNSHLETLVDRLEVENDGIKCDLL